MTEETLDKDFLGEPTPEQEIIIEPVYPSISDRVKAVFTDTFIMVIFMIIATFIFSFFENIPDNARMVTFIFIVFLYDPLFTTFFGGTIGHMMNGIRVKREKDESKNIILPLAFFRFIFKTFLGWISLLTVTGNKKRKAIHDMIVRSIVVYNKKP